MKRSWMLMMLLAGLLLFCTACGGDDGDDDDDVVSDGDTDDDDDDDVSDGDTDDDDDDDDVSDGDTDDDDDDDVTDGDTDDDDDDIDGDLDGDEDGDGEEPVLTRLHFHLAHDENFLSINEDYVLHVHGQRIPLVAHTDETRAEHPSLFDEDDTDDDIEPTHYVDVGDLPTDRVLRMHITQRSDNEGHLRTAQGDEVDHGLAFPIIHIPTEARMRLIETSRKSFKRYKDGAGEISEDTLNTYTPLDIAKTVVFHHPDLANLDADTAANIMMNHIEEAPGLNDLAFAIKAMGRHGWYEMDPVMNEDDTQHTFENGDPMFQYNIKDEVIQAAATVVQYVLRTVKNDPSLVGKHYHPTTGVGSLTVPESTRRKDGTYDFNMGKTGFHSGFRSRVASIDGTNVELKFRNDWVRHLGVYAEFYDENDTRISLSESDWMGNAGWLTDTTIRDWLDTDEVKFLSLSSPVPEIFGIPAAGDYTETNVSFDWPDEARYAKIRAGGLGHGGSTDKAITTMGISLTSVFELGIPTILLGVGVGMADGGATLNDLVGDTTLASAIVQFFFSTIWSSGNSDFGSISKKLGRLMGNFLVTRGAQKIVTFIAMDVTEAEVEEEIPFAGWVLAAANIAALTSQLAQASAETASSPWIIENTVSPTHPIQVTINHDPNDYQFPATATHYRLVATFSKTDSRVVERQLPGVTVSDPIVVTLDDMPAGGHVTFTVGFYSDTNWLAGQGQAEFLNVNSDGVTYLDASITIKENLVPLDSNSVYRHKQKLTIDSGAHVWTAALDTPPTATRVNLSEDQATNAISELVNLSINQRTGDLGYVWKAYTPGVLECQNSGTGQMYVYQNLSAKQDPDSNLKFSGCGYNDKPYMFYSLGVPTDEQVGKVNLDLEEQNFVLLPEDDQWLYVRHVDLTPGLDFGIDHTKSYCKFPLRLDSAVVHPLGSIVGINHASPRLFTCTLTDDPVLDADTNVASIAVDQLHNLDQLAVNPALLAKPLALSLGADNAVLVLDDVSDITTTNVKAVIRAFNPDGTPLAYFGDALCDCDDGYIINPDDPTSCIQDDPDADHSGPNGICGGHGSFQQGAFVLSLKEETDPVTYLDFGVEHKGYIYVLSYGNNGDQASDYRMDIYEPDGTWLVRTTNIPADKLTVDLWRNIYTMNYELLLGPSDRSEPSISEWIPPTPPGR